MNLRDYLHVKRMTVTALAKELGLNRMYLNSVKTGKKKCSILLAKKLEDYTNGAVKMKDMLERNF